MDSMTTLGMHVPMGREARQPWVRAALFAAACELGAFISEASPEIIGTLKTFGAKLGTAYQIYDDILEAVGGTPLVRLNKLVPATSARVLVKFEGMNVGGSIKTRTALRMIREAEARGDLHERSIIVEPTSGNQGIGLALVAAVLGYRARIIMPDSVSIERRRLVSHYGALVLTVHDSGDIGACIQECIARALRMAAEDENVYVPQQFENADNVAAHYEGTGAEILRDVDGPIDGFCSGIGTGGTITGVGRALRDANPDVRIWAAEPENAAILSGSHVRADRPR